MDLPWEVEDFGEEEYRSTSLSVYTHQGYISLSCIFPHLFKDLYASGQKSFAICFKIPVNKGNIKYLCVCGDLVILIICVCVYAAYSFYLTNTFVPNIMGHHVKYSLCKAGITTNIQQ